MNRHSARALLARRLPVMLVALTMLAPVVSGVGSQVSATESGPSGVNVGFDFSWDDAANPAGHSASFLETDGFRANNCSGGTLTATTKTCNFVFEYDIDGSTRQKVSHAARWIKWANVTAYSAGKPVGATGCSSGSSQAGELGKAPLTLFDCFNTSSFGQVFRPSVNGALTQFRMAMSCLAPSGVPRFEMYALLYEMSSDGNTIVSTSPLGATLVNLSRCPTASTWNGKTFNAASFAMIPMTFGNPQLVAGRFYGLYLTGNGVPGSVPPGAASAMAAAKAAATTTTTSTTTTTTTPWSSFRGETATAAPASPSGKFTALGASREAMTAVELMTSAQNKTYFINSLTPTVCLGSDRFMVFLKTGRCRAQVIVRRNGAISATVTTRIVANSGTSADIAVAKPTVLYFANGTNRLTAASTRKLNALVPDARRAKSILVTGHTGNASGENADLVPLSRRRATYVRSLLRGKGARQTIAIWSFGGTSPLSTSKSEAAQAKNRRAEVFLVP